MMATQNLNRTNNNFGGGQSSQIKSPYSQYNGIPKQSPAAFGQQTQLDFLNNTSTPIYHNSQTPVNVAEDNLRPLSGTDSDPIALFLATINKLHFLTNSLPPSLNKDHRLIQVETFYKEIFCHSQRDAMGRSGHIIKVEINKLHACSREIISCGGGVHQGNATVLRNITYEKLNQ